MQLPERVVIVFYLSAVLVVAKKGFGEKHAEIKAA